MCCGMIIFSADNDLDKKVLWLIVPHVKEKNTRADTRVDLFLPYSSTSCHIAVIIFIFVIFLELNYVRTQKV